jgi:prepilin-type processing-associated H-X9-DG protein
MAGQWNYNTKSNSRCLNDGLFVYKLRRKIKQITDGTSKTLAIGEVQGEDTFNGVNLWTQAFRDGSMIRNSSNPINTPPGAPFDKPLADCRYGPCWNGAFGSNHPGGALFCFADGHVTFVRETISSTVYKAASTFAGGETDVDLN